MASSTTVLTRGVLMRRPAQLTYGVNPPASILQPGSQMVIPEVAKVIVPAAPKMGIVVSTFGTPAYVHLQLESAKRHYPMPILVHDDSSGVDFGQLCTEYKADFYCTPGRLGHFPGDISAFKQGLLWASKKSLDILIKISRRCLPLVDWRGGLAELVRNTQHCSYTSPCRYYGFLFRSELCALHVPSWMEVWPHFDTYCNNESVEGYMFDMAQLVKVYRGDRGTLDGEYAVWPFLGDSRHWMNPNIAWHDVSPPERYLEIAQKWGLDYTLNDFKV